MSGTIADWERDQFSRRAADAISALPETTEPLEPPVLPMAPDPDNDPITLMERTVGGWSTQLCLCPGGRVAVVCQRGEDAPIEAVFVALDKALDAFHHPYCYLPRD